MSSIKLNNQLRHALRRVMFTGRSYTVEPPATIERDTLIEFQADDDGTVTYAVLPDPTKTGAVPWPDSEPAKQFTLEWRFSPTAKPTFSSTAVDRALRLKLRERRKGVTYLLSARRDRRDPPHPPHRGRLLRLPPLVGSAAAVGAVIAATALGYVGIVQGKLLGNLHVGGPHRPTIIVTPTFTTVPVVPSTITITAPADNSNVLSTTPTTFTATATDIHANPLADSAFTWKDDVDGVVGTSSSIQHAPTVKGGGACTISKHHVTVTALDPLEPGTLLVASITVNAYTGATCKLAITAPANTTTNTGQSVTFTASATNALGSAVPDSAISWTDDVDGGLGTGHTVTHTPSLPGDPCAVTKHHVTVTSGKLSATVTVSTYTGAACKLTITAPANNSNVHVQVSTTFAATETDAVGNVLPGSGISWSDDVDGNLGAGSNVQHVLTYDDGCNSNPYCTPQNCLLYAHHITATSAGRTATLTVKVYTGVACHVTITAPANNVTVSSTSPTTLSATEADAAGNKLPCGDIQWYDSVDAGSGTGCTIQHHFNAPCSAETTHQMNASAGQASATITVTTYYGGVCTASITAPANGTYVDFASPTTLSAVAGNAIGGAAAGATFNWSDSADGYLGSGSSIQHTFSGGPCVVATHVVTLTVTDNSGGSASSSITLYTGYIC